MKRNISLIAVLFLLSMSIFSCKKDDFNYPEGYVGESKITVYPELTLNGDQLTIINQGTTYTDEGVVAKIGEQEVEYASSGTVDSSTPGVYVINYSAKNEDGFSASSYRTVVVMSTAGDINSHDFSGTYDRDGFPQTSTWTKTANGVYTVQNPGGAAGVTVTAVNFEGNKIVVPQQECEAGTMSSSIGTYDLAAGKYVWAIVNAGYGGQDRTFIKK
ncbi:immunoglobulin-like domain-containing protein [Rubrolithibacter danxiaensis]|uniref:immunoglobulin-like domain-containing protein n=1 Tax=Rubrolithibacter danxiaensis TaxID=3390805 RepID=UPI003BF8A4B1